MVAKLVESINYVTILSLDNASNGENREFSKRNIDNPVKTVFKAVSVWTTKSELIKLPGYSSFTGETQEF
jgi:hypothetical protein